MEWKSTRRYLVLPVCIVLVGWLLGVGASPAYAHDAVISATFPDFTPQEFEHEDADPWKGWAEVTVTNTGTEPWGDFHFEIYQVPGQDPIDDVSFVVDSPYEPYTTDPAITLTWDVDNDVVGATLDLYHYGDPVGVGETITYHVYTDNTVNSANFFGLLIYPTPVPEPGTLAFLALGGAALLRRRR